MQNRQKHKIKKCLTVVLIGDKISLVANEMMWKKLWKKLLTQSWVGDKIRKSLEAITKYGLWKLNRI